MKFANIENISAEFDAMVPAIAAEFSAWVTKNLEFILSAYDRKELSQLGGSWSSDGGKWRQLRTFTIMVDENDEQTNRLTYRYKIAHDRIAKESVRYAQEQVDAFKFKLNKKLADLTDIENLRIGSTDFQFTGMLGENKVRVEQTTVLKCSNKGTLFNQWPCRIYLNGKFISEAAFKKLSA
jgi:hypothetical protein